MTAPSGAIAVRDHPGDGPPLLFLHAAGLNLAAWDAVVAALPSFRCVTLDLPGHGRSHELHRWDWDGVDTALDAVASACALERPVVIGHSLGGWVALRYAARRRCTGAISVDGWVGPPWPNPLPKEGLDNLPAVERSETFVGRARVVADAAGVPWDLAEPVVARQGLALGGGLVRVRPTPGEWRHLADAADGLDLARDVAAAPCPVHVILAAEAETWPGSAFAGPAAQRERVAALCALLETAHGSVSWETLPCSHQVPLLLPGPLAAAIARTVERWRRATA